VGWEKEACWSTKAAISLKRAKTEEKLLWRAHRKSPTLFPTVPFPTPYGLLFPLTGVRDPLPKLQSLLSQERAKLRTSNLARTITGSIRTKSPEKFWRKGSVAYPGIAQIFRVSPIISGTGKATDFKFGQYIQRVRPNKILLKILEKGKRRRIQGLPIFRVPLLSQEREKVRNSNLASTFRGSIRAKVH